jgi:SAM-dependent methyltransferase
MPAEDRAQMLTRLRPAVQRARDFSGWDLGHVAPTVLDPEPSWDYAHLAVERGRHAASVLDMGTGGGELLAELRAGLPGRVLATEEWQRNVPVASRRLAPLGVPVVWCRSLNLPFADASFDLVLNRHEELNPAEVARVMRPGAHAITQQVGGSTWHELRRFFPRMTDFGDLCGEYRRGFAASGLVIVDAREHEYRVRYQLDALVYLLAIMPWSIPDFDLDGDLDALLALESASGGPEGVTLTDNRFLIVARKPI